MDKLSGKKILHMTSSYYPNEDGVSKVVQKYSEYYSSIGVDSWVLTSSDCKNFSKINGVSIKYLNIYGNEVKGISGDVEEFYKFLKEMSFDVIVTYAPQTWHFDLISKMSKSNFNNAKLVCFTVGFSGLIGLRRFRYKKYYKNMRRRLEKFDLIIPHSKKYIDYEFLEKKPIDNVRVLPNGFDPKEFSSEVELTRFKEEFFKKHNIAEHKRIILNVSNHVYAKGHRDYIRLSKKFDDYIFINVGNDTSRVFNCTQRCRKESLKYDDEGSNYLSIKLNRSDLIKLFKISYLFLLTSNTEAFPLVILESIAADLPFISYDVGNVKEMPGGIVVKDYKSMKLEVENFTKERYLCLIDNMSKSKKDFEWEYILTKYKEYLEELI